MKNEDCPAYPIDEETTDRFMEGVHIETGETKFEKAYWQVYSAMLVSCDVNRDYVAGLALEATKEGFKALESLKEST